MFKSVSIIIPALNEEKYIEKCLKAINELDRINLELEVIVIDNGSKDRTVSIARECGAKVFVKTGMNISALRNYGVSISKGDLIAFIDADCEVAKDWLSQALKTMTVESADVVGNFYTAPKESGWIGRTSDMITKKKHAGDIKYFPAGNMFLSRSCFEAVGGFNISLETSEDVDLCHRLRDKGYKLCQTSDLCSIHYGTPKNIKGFIKRELWHGKTMVPIFLSDLRSGKKLRSVRNLSLIMFSSANLIFIIGMVAGVYPMLTGANTLFITCAALYLLLNFAMAMRDWVKVRKDLPYLFGYIVIYGIARSLSLARGVLKEGLGVFGSTARTR